MISGLYSAATAMDAAETRHRASAENLAHAHMPGFRRRMVHQTSFAAAMQGRPDAGSFGPSLGTSAGSSSDPQIEIDFTRGNLKTTGRPLDMALEDEGFFVVEGEEEPLYTRNGSFIAHPDGRLVTIDGLTVMGEDGPIELPNGTPGETVSVTRDGRLIADGVEFARVRMVRFENVQELTPVGASLFKAEAGAGPEDGEPTVLQGFVEASNVAHMDELVNILVASRQYEAAQRALTMIEQSLDKHVSGT